VRVRKFDFGDSRRPLAISVGSEHLALPGLHRPFQEVDVLLGRAGADVRFMPFVSGVVAVAATLRPARAALQTLLRRRANGSARGPDEQAHSRTSSTVLATAYATDGRALNRVRLDGVNSYTFGFDSSHGAASMAAMREVSASGALGPVAAFG
jgi:hypothetical protein